MSFNEGIGAKEHTYGENKCQPVEGKGKDKEIPQVQGREVKQEKRNVSGIGVLFRRQASHGEGLVKDPIKPLPTPPLSERRTTYPSEQGDKGGHVEQTGLDCLKRRAVPSAEVRKGKHTAETHKNKKKEKNKRKNKSVQRSHHPAAVPSLKLGSSLIIVPATVRKDDSLHVHHKTNIPTSRLGSSPPEGSLEEEMEIHKPSKTARVKLKGLLNIFHDKSIGKYASKTEKDILETAKWMLFFEEMENLQSEEGNLSERSASDVDKYELKRIEDFKDELRANHGILLQEALERLLSFKEIVLTFYRKNQIEHNKKLSPYFNYLINVLRDLTHTNYDLFGFLRVLNHIKEPITHNMCESVISPEVIKVLEFYARPDSEIAFEKLQEQTLPLARRLQKFRFSNSTPWQEPANLPVPLLLNSCENVTGSGNDKYGGVCDYIFINSKGKRVIVTNEVEKRGDPNYYIWPEEIIRGTSITPNARMNTVLTFLIDVICRTGIHPPLKSVTINYFINQLMSRKKTDRYDSVEDYELYEQENKENKEKFDEYIIDVFKKYRGDIYEKVLPFVQKEQQVSAFCEILKLLTKKSIPKFDPLLKFIEPDKVKEFLVVFNDVLLNYFSEVSQDVFENLEKSVDKRFKKKGIVSCFGTIVRDFKTYVSEHTVEESTDLLIILIKSLRGKKRVILPDMDFLRAVEENLQLPYISKLFKAMDFAPTAKFTDNFKQAHKNIRWDQYNGPFNKEFKGQFTGKTLQNNLIVQALGDGRGFFISQLRNLEIFYHENDEAKPLNFAALSVKCETKFDAAGFELRTPKIEAIRIHRENLFEEAGKEKENELESAKELPVCKYKEFSTILKRWRRVLGANDEFKFQQLSTVLLSPRNHAGSHLLKELLERPEEGELDDSDDEQLASEKEPAPIKAKPTPKISLVVPTPLQTNNPSQPRQLSADMLRRTRSFSHPHSKDDEAKRGN